MMTGKKLVLASALILAGMCALPLGVGIYPQHVLITSLFYVMMAASWNLLAGYTGQVSFGHAAMAGIGAYTGGAKFGERGAVAVLAVAVNFVELLCTAGLPAIYTAVLTQQGLSPAAYYGYLGLYIAGYIADDALMVTVAVLALGNLKLTERGGQWLKLLSGLVMLVLGAVVLLSPDWLV